MCMYHLLHLIDKEIFTVKKQSSFSSLLLCNIIILMISLSIVFISYNAFQRSLTNSTQDYTTIILNQLRQTFDEKVTIFNRVILDISNNAYIRPLINHQSPLSSEDIYNSHMLINRLSDYKVVYSFIDSLCIYFPESELLISNESCYSSFDEYVDISKTNLWTKEEFLAMLTPNRTLQYYSPSNTTDFFSVVVPFDILIPSSNSPYIVLNIESSFIKDTLKNNNLLQEYALFIFDTDDNLLFSSSEGSISNLISTSDLQNINELLSVLDPSIYTLTKVNSKLLNWKYFFVTTTSLLPAATMNILTVLFILLLIILSIICCIVFANKNYSPIKKLLALIKETSGSSFSATEKHNEFEFISTSILGNYSQYSQLKNELVKRIPDLQNQSIQQLLNGTILDWKSFKSELPSIHLLFPKPTLYVILLELVPYLATSLSLSSIATLKLKEFIHSQFNEDDYSYSIILSSTRLGFIINTPKDPATFYSFITQLHTCSIQFLKTILPCSLTLGCSDSTNNLEEVSILYNHSLTSLEHQLIILPGQISFYDQLLTHNYTFYYPSELEHKLISHIKKGNIDLVSVLITDVILKNITNNQLSVETSKCLFFSIMGTAIKTINLLGLNISEIFSTDPYKQFIECTNLADMEVSLREVFYKLCKYISLRNLSDNTLSQDILLYIQQNFSNSSLDLTYLAEHFSLSANYLSRYLKESTGHNFMTYITDLRLKHAKYLLTHSNYSIKDIANQCGYSNSAGLIRNFKKSFGITPGQFRDEIKNNL